MKFTLLRLLAALCGIAVVVNVFWGAGIWESFGIAPKVGTSVLVLVIILILFALAGSRTFADEETRRQRHKE